jgi:hypothetical protein
MNSLNIDWWNVDWGNVIGKIIIDTIKYVWLVKYL